MSTILTIFFQQMDYFRLKLEKRKTKNNYIVGLIRGWFDSIYVEVVNSEGTGLDTQC